MATLKNINNGLPNWLARLASDKMNGWGYSEVDDINQRIELLKQLAHKERI
jgi:hypothetical protein